MAKIIILGMVILVVVFGAIAVISQEMKKSTSLTSLQNQTGGQVTPIQQQQNSVPPTVVPTPVNLTTLPRVTAQQATIHTEKGDIIMQLYPQDAPKTVMNFATLAQAGYYNGLTFHRVVPGFVVQGGDPNGNGTGGVSIYGPTFADELDASSSSYQAGYMTGVVAMANRGPNTNGSQFFIMLADNPTLPHAYTIFGKVIQGMDVVKQIQQGDKMVTVTVQ